MKRVVLITGSTRGIGFSTAAEFLKHGDQVMIFCRHKGHVEKARRELVLAAPKENILSLAGDVRNSKDVKRIVAQCMKRFGRIDILINNAGIGTYKEIQRVSEKEWDDILDTNLKGTFLFIRQILPFMKRQRSGIIINISSGLGVAGEAKFSAYCASKFGVVGLTQVVADEAAESGIKVFAVLPGAVNTSLISDVGLEMDPSELMAPDYLARRIFEVAEGKEQTGKLVEVYS
jgi:3-oxoacyl-[acyl-carrier protein] reductase